jgi:hypothetical protein
VTPTLTAANAKVEAKADALARAYNYEHELEDLRAAIKADAIKRIQKRDGLAATPAEKIVETDEEYFAHRGKQSAAVVARFKADAEYWAAKCEATQASLITPEVLLLESKLATLKSINRHLTHELVEENDRLTIAKGANADLVQANRELASQRAATSEMLGKARHELATVHGLQATDKPDTFSEALRDGCDASGAARAVAEVSWTLDVESLIKEIDALLGVSVEGA